jgi:hypothetical protein
MVNQADKPALVLIMLPYLSLALYDGWLHESARRVPRKEQALHGMALLSVVGLIAGLFLGLSGWILPSVAGFAVTTTADELGFHRSLPRKERRIHFAAYACFAGFLIEATRMGALS